MTVKSCLINPPAIVKQAEMSEQQIVDGIGKATSRDNFSVGRLAIAWHETYSHSRSDATLADLVNRAYPDGQISSDYIRDCRTVAAKCPERSGHLTWSHHYYAVRYGKDRFAYWLERAEAKKWSAAQLRTAIIKRQTGDPAKIDPDVNDAIRRCVRDVLGGRGRVTDPQYIRDFLATHGGYVYHQKDKLVDLAKRMKASADIMLKFANGERKES